MTQTCFSDCALILHSFDIVQFHGSIRLVDTIAGKCILFAVLQQISRLVGKPTMWFPNRSDTNRPVHAQKRARSLKFRIYVPKRNCTIRVAKAKALISFAVTAKLICVFVFAYADCWFSHEAAHIILTMQTIS